MCVFKRGDGNDCDDDNDGDVERADDDDGDAANDGDYGGESDDDRVGMQQMLADIEEMMEMMEMMEEITMEVLGDDRR